MFPRIVVFIHPLNLEGLYRLRLVKGWWDGRGHAGSRKTIAEFEVSLKATDETERIREALRAAADLL